MTLHLAAVAPAAPAVGYGVVALGALVAFVVALGLQNLWRATFGPLLTWLGNLGINISHGLIHVSIHPFGFAKSVNHNIEAALDWAVVNSERGMTWAFGRAVAFIKDVTHTIENVAASAYHGIRGVEHTATKVVVRTVRETVVRPVVRTVTVTKAISASTLRAFDHRLDALTARVAHLAHALTVPVAAIPSRVGYTSKQLRRMARRIDALEKRTVGAGAAAVLAVSLARLGLSWVRCANVVKVGKRLCRFNSGILESLLGGFALLYVSEGLVPLAHDAQRVFGTISGTVLSFLRANTLGHGGDRALGSPTLTTHGD